MMTIKRETVMNFGVEIAFSFFYNTTMCSRSPVLEWPEIFWLIGKDFIRYRMIRTYIYVICKFNLIYT